MNFKLETPNLTGFVSYSPLHIGSASPKSRVTFQKVNTQSTHNFGQKSNKITIKKFKTGGPSNFLASNIITNPSNSKNNLRMTPFAYTSQNFTQRINHPSYQVRSDYDHFEGNEASPKFFDIKGIKQQQQGPCKITPISLNAQVLIPVDEQTPTDNSTKKSEVGYNHFKKAIATFWGQSNVSTSSSTLQSRCHSAASRRVTTMTQITESSSPNPYSRNEPYKKPYQIFSQKQPLSMAKINIESKTMHDSNIVEKSTNISTNVSKCEKVMFISMDHGHSTNFDSLKTGAEKSRKVNKELAFSKLIKSKETAGTPRLDFPEAKPSPYFARVMSAKTTSNVFKVKKSTNLYDTKSLKHHSASQKKLSTFVNPAENPQIQETFANYIKNKLQRSSIISDSRDNSLTNTQVETTTINRPKSKKVSISLPQQEEEDIQPPKEEPSNYTIPIMSKIPLYDENKSASPNIETILTSPKNVGKKPTTLQRPFTSKPVTTTITLFHEKKPKHANERIPYQRGFTRSSTNQHLQDSDSFEIEGWGQDNDVEF